MASLFSWKRVLEYGLIFILSFLFYSYYQFQSAYLPGTDGYYHIKIAWIMREYGFLSNFKWAHLSLWCENFSDKEFLFHVLLIPFTYFSDMIFGAKIATVSFAATGMTSFYGILRLNKIKFPWFWLILLCVSGGYFLYRTNVPRPQIFSIIFVLWSIHFLINRKRIPLAILCFIYTYSYTAYHLPFIFACIVYIYHLIFEKENDWKTPAIVLAATISGMILSPFFPDNWELFYLQNFYILWMSSQSPVDLHMGGEFGPMSTRNMIVVNASVIIPIILAFFTSMYYPKKLNKKTISLFLIALSLIVLTCFSKRFTEYSVPVGLLFCAFFFSPYLERFELRKELSTIKGKLFSIAIIGAIVFLSINSWVNTISEFKGVKSLGLEKAAKYLEKHTEENELVFTADWDDAPELFFFNHKNRYLVFLDPNFMYYWNPDIWKRWDDISNGRLGKKTYDVLKDEFNIRYGVATNNFSGLKNIIRNDKRMEVVFNSPGGFVFKLTDETANSE